MKRTIEKGSIKGAFRAKRKRLIIIFVVVGEERGRAKGSKSERAGTSLCFFSFVALHPAPVFDLFRALSSSLPALYRSIASHSTHRGEEPVQSMPRKHTDSPCKRARPWPLWSSSTTFSSEGCPTCPRPCCRAAAPALAPPTWPGRLLEGPSSPKWRPCP